MHVDSTYAKPFLTIPQQIHRMRQRGMDCGLDRDAADLLQRYGYYRLSGYSHTHRMRPTPPAAKVDASGREIRLDDFEPGTTLSRVVEMYEFDQELRSRIADALSALEVSFRFFIGHRLGRLDAFAHRRPEMMDAMQPAPKRWSIKDLFRTKPQHTIPSVAYLDWIAEYDRHEKRAKDRFVHHFRAKYGAHLPIWVGTEVMSFGVLSTLYRLMPGPEQEILAARFQLLAKSGRGDSGALSNWLNNLRHIRNICAHYGRVWNRTFDVLIDTPGREQSSAGKSPQVGFDHLAKLVDRSINNKIYGVLLVMRHLMLSTNPARDDVIGILEFADAESARIGFDLAEMGIPATWRSEPVWERRYRLPEEPMLAASVLDRTVCLSTNETRKLLDPLAKRPGLPMGADSSVSAARRELLRTYRRYNTLIEVPLAGVNYFPVFQFRDGAMINEVGEINKAFIDANAATDVLAVHSSLLDWWQAPQAGLPLRPDGSQSSPCDVLVEYTEPDFKRIITTAAATSSLVLR